MATQHQVVTVTFDGSNISPSPPTAQMQYGPQDSITWKLNNTSGQAANFSDIYFKGKPDWPGDDPVINGAGNVASVADVCTPTNTLTYDYGINISYGIGNVMCLDPIVVNEPDA